MFISDEDREFIRQRCVDSNACQDVLDLFNQRCAEQAQLETVISELRDTIFQTDEEGQFTFLSPSWQDLTGRPVADCIGTTCWQYIHPDDEHLHHVLVKSLLNGTLPHVLREVRCQHLNGEIRVTEIHVHPIKNDEDEVTGTTGIIRDVTNRNRARQMLRAYRNIVSSTQDGISLINRDYTYLMVNDAYLARLGLSRDEVEGHSMPEVIDTAAFENIIKVRLDRCFAGETQEYVTWFEYPAAGWRCVRVMYYPYRDGSGRITGAIINSRDITDEKRAEDELRSREERFRTLAENSPDIITRITQDSKHVYANPALAEMLHIPLEDIIGKTNEEIYAPHDSMSAYAAMRDHIFETGEALNTEFSYPSPDGERYFHMRLVPEFNSAGQVETILSVGRDITDRKQMEDALAASQDALHRLIEQIPVGIQVFDKNGTCTDANQAHLDIFGITAEDIVGIYNIFEDHLADLMGTREAAARALQGETVKLGDLNFDFSRADPRYAAVDQGLRSVDVTIVPIFDGSGQVTSFVGLNVDITERKQMEQNLRRSEEQYRLITENTSDGILLWDAVADQVLYASPAYQRLWGRTIDETLKIQRKDVYERIHPDERDELFARINRVTKAQEPSATYTYRYLHNDGMYHWREDRTNYVYDEDGNLLRVYLASRDVTEHRRAQDALVASEELLRTIIDHIPVMVSLTDPEGNLQYTNRQFVKLLGWQLDQLAPDQDPMMIFFPDQEQRQRIAEYTDAGHEAWVDVSMRTSNGNMLDTTWMNVRLNDGRNLSIGLDITARKHAQQRELEYRLERERIQILNHFIESAAHEFRTPLSIIGTSVYFLHRSDDLQRRQQKLDQISTQVKRITRLVDMMLQMVKLESRNPVRLLPVKISNTLSQVVHIARNHYGEKPQLQMMIPLDMPTVIGNEDAIYTGLMHLLENAYHFTPPDGQITISAIQQGDQVWIDVRDSGHGVSPEVQPHIFEVFWRQDIAHTTPGFGLGLPIAQKMFQQCGGDLQLIDPSAGHCTFRIILQVSDGDE